MKYYKVSEIDLKYLIESRARLEALESGGVDNWSSYCDANSDYLADIKEEYDIPMEEDLDFKDIADREIKEFEEV